LTTRSRAGFLLASVAAVTPWRVRITHRTALIFRRSSAFIGGQALFPGSGAAASRD